MVLGESVKVLQENLFRSKKEFTPTFLENLLAKGETIIRSGGTDTGDVFNLYEVPENKVLYLFSVDFCLINERENIDKGWIYIDSATSKVLLTLAVKSGDVANKCITFNYFPLKVESGEVIQMFSSTDVTTFGGIIGILIDKEIIGEPIGDTGPLGGDQAGSPTGGSGPLGGDQAGSPTGA